MGNDLNKFTSFHEAMSIYEQYKPLHTKCKTKSEAESVLFENQKEGYWGQIIEEENNNQLTFTVTQYIMPPISLGLYEIEDYHLAKNIINIANNIGLSVSYHKHSDARNTSRHDDARNTSRHDDYYIILIGIGIYKDHIPIWIPPFYSKNKMKNSVNSLPDFL
jgi:hypothetical protein